jgi:hypothetical protein
LHGTHLNLLMLLSKLQPLLLLTLLSLLILQLLKLLSTHPNSSYVYGLIASATCTSSRTALDGKRDAAVWAWRAPQHTRRLSTAL